MGFPTKNDHFGVVWGYHHLRKPQNGSKEKKSFLEGWEGGEGGCFFFRLDIGIACRKYLQSHILRHTQIQVPLPEVKLGTLFKVYK